MTASTTTGAQALVRAAVRHGVEVCFANPGTTEMPLVAALDEVPGIRAVLGLHENVCTGAADGYARISGRPAMTLLHLGPGLANGLANLHNARRAHTPLVNVVGDHASWHLPYDAPLTSDIAALAGTVGTVHTTVDADGIDQITGAAIEQTCRTGGITTIVVPADHQQESTIAPPMPAERVDRYVPIPAEDIREVANRLRAAGPRSVLLLGGNALTRAGQAAAERISAGTQATLFCETFPARAERGGGLPDIDRLPYFPENAVAALKEADVVVVAGADKPIAYFGYTGIPSELAPAHAVVELASPHGDAETALCALAELVGSAAPHRTIARPQVPADDEPLTGSTVAITVAACLPENAVVSIEGGTCGYPFYTASAGAPAHTVLTNTGGAIGQGLPAALGAAIAAPERQVIALQSDGSGLYTAQALWTMARECTDVIVLIAANHTYNVLRTELARHGNAAFGPQATALTSLAEPQIDWVALATGFGVPARRVDRVGALTSALRGAIAAGGPQLIEMAL
ncbi:acetolactate synthase large subunit [Mycolicibacterium sp. CH28]|uniref:acetolactate synthase large subunit n=1 Tax=Mycolicibacterium sp. CH28 TaxID=2512237 RepID=UPI001081CA71|nr:acetolactate synthase large subunit [Mycolicibacterium sp. CH28]TGD88033.1 acetolactate synthase large subunit [Mycolicibacterium sp. CH28]